MNVRRLVLHITPDDAVWVLGADNKAHDLRVEKDVVLHPWYAERLKMSNGDIPAFLAGQEHDPFLRGRIIFAVKEELERALKKHPVGFHTPHEGYAVLQEEVDELWDLVKADQGAGENARQEAIQVAAMALRYLLDICYRSK